MGNDFLTESLLYLYLRFFAGIGFDYSVVAAKVGISGQVYLDMAFERLNRLYMDSKDTIINVANQLTNQGSYNLDGQNFKIRGTVGLEVLFKPLFISCEKILCSKTFNLLNEKTGQWETIQTNWGLNSKANRVAISGMVKNGSLNVYSAGGQQMVSLNLVPMLEDHSYLENGLKTLESNTYPYANLVIIDDGQLVAHLHDGGSPNAEDTMVKYATRSGSSYNRCTDSMAVSAWTRQMTGIQKAPVMAAPETSNPVSGADKNGDPIYSLVLTADEQMMMLNGTEIYVSIYANRQWTTHPAD